MYCSALFMCSNQHTDTDKLGQPSNWKCKNRNKLGNQKSRFPLEKKNAINAGTKMAVDPKTYIYIILFSFSFFQQTSALKLWNRYSFDWEIFLLLIFVSHALHAFTLQHFFLCEGWINLFFAIYVNLVSCKGIVDEKNIYLRLNPAHSNRTKSVSNRTFYFL